MNVILTPAQLVAIHEHALIITGAPLYLEHHDAVLYWQQGDEHGYLSPEGVPLERVELGLRENGVAPPPDPEPGVYYAGEEYEPLTAEEVAALMAANPAPDDRLDEGGNLSTAWKAWASRAAELVYWRQYGAPTRTMICQYLAAGKPPHIVTPVTAETNQDGEVFCTGCASTEFEYRESIPSWRDMRANEGRRLVFAGSGEDGDGDDDPGVVCSGCERPVILPDGVSVDWATC